MLVRVRNTITGHEYNIAAALAEVVDTLTVLDKPTHTRHGAEIPAKHSLKTPRQKGGSTASVAADNTEAKKEADQ